MLDRLCAGFGLCITAVGLYLLAGADMPAYWRWPAMLGWLLLAEYRRPRPRVGRLRVFADGRVLLGRGRAHWVDGRLARGCVLLPGVAWLLVSHGRQGLYGALFLRSEQPASDWRRLQLLVRHFAAV